MTPFCFPHFISSYSRSQQLSQSDTHRDPYRYCKFNYINASFHCNKGLRPIGVPKVLKFIMKNGSLFNFFTLYLKILFKHKLRTGVTQRDFHFRAIIQLNTKIIIRNQRISGVQISENDTILFSSLYQLIQQKLATVAK